MCKQQHGATNSIRNNLYITKCNCIIANYTANLFVYKRNYSHLNFTIECFMICVFLRNILDILLIWNHCQFAHISTFTPFIVLIFGVYWQAFEWHTVINTYKNNCSKLSMNFTNWAVLWWVNFRSVFSPVFVSVIKYGFKKQHRC